MLWIIVFSPFTVGLGVSLIRYGWPKIGGKTYITNNYYDGLEYQDESFGDEISNDELYN